MKLTLGALAYRALWEADRRSGFKALRTPRGQVPIPASVPPHAEWLQELGGEHRLRALADAAYTKPVEGEPHGDWHFEPDARGRWPAREHWTKAIDARLGDLRFTWERNRFGHVWGWIRGGVDAAQTFEAEVLDWRYENPFRSGVNWASGQELAVRSLAWLAGGAAYGARMTPRGWQDLVELLYWHGVHIESEFGFARRTVRNNHVIAEGLALAAIADAFGGFDEASRWRARGLAAVTEALDEQFLPDGGYCQCSHAYHSFALELLFEAADWFEELRELTKPIFARSAPYFEALLEPGGLPNLGPNDRAEVVDYAALLAELRRRAGLEPGPTPRSASFPDAGLHVMRRGGTTVTLRAGELPDRAGHDDGLHVDIWHDGRPVTLDPGSFRYSGPEHHYWAGARSHNVCYLGVSEPRKLVRPFTWDRVTRPHLEELDERRGLIVARYDDAFPGARWERRIRVTDDGVEVEDLLNGTPPRLARAAIAWVLDVASPSQVRVEEGECFTWNITSPVARITMRAEPLVGALNLPSCTASAVFTSPAYGQLRDSTRIDLIVAASAVRFVSRFVPR